MTSYTKLTFDQTKGGLHWAHNERGEWALVEIRVDPHRIYVMAVEIRVDPHRIYVMAWDCRCDPSDYDYFVCADLVTPDGKPYET